MTKPLLAALAREPLATPPVWLMRQAGRYLPEYQRVRAQAGGFLAMCHDPALAAEVTLQPVRRFGVDGAVLFSDILLPLAAMGMDLSFEEGKGPVFGSRLKDAADVDALKPVKPAEAMPYVGRALELVAAELPSHTALLGFAGAPFTLACYAVEGGHARDQHRLRTLMYREPETYHRLATKLADMVAEHLAFQVDHGAEAVVLFDTWAGELTREDYLRFCAPYSQRALESVAGRVPRMAFVRSGGHMLDDVADVGAEALALDWRVDIRDAFDRFGDRLALQGNLDPAVLLGPPEEVTRRTVALLDRVDGRPGHVLALGHGVMRWTQPEAVEAFVQAARSWTPAAAAARA